MRWSKIIFLSAIVLIIFGGIFMLRRGRSVDMEFPDDGKAVFHYNGSEISSTLSEEDLSLIYGIFDGKRLYKDDPSCGFNENIAIHFNDSQIFCIACDGCPIIYWKNQNRYFNISEKQNEQLRDILEEYGFVFPCI